MFDVHFYLGDDTVWHQAAAVLLQIALNPLTKQGFTICINIINMQLWSQLPKSSKTWVVSVEFPMYKSHFMTVSDRLVEQLMDRSTVCFLGPDTLQLPGATLCALEKAAKVYVLQGELSILLYRYPGNNLNPIPPFQHVSQIHRTQCQVTKIPQM